MPLIMRPHGVPQHLGMRQATATVWCVNRQAELQEQLASVGLSKTGNKADLIARLTEAFSSASAVPNTSGEHLRYSAHANKQRRAALKA